MQELDQMLTIVHIAEMMGISHKNILQKLEGRNIKGNHVEEVIEVIGELKLQPSDYFIKSFYIDSKGEKRPCYNVTRKGCEFLANK